MSLETIPIHLRRTTTAHSAAKLRGRLAALRAGLASVLPPGQVLFFVGGRQRTREALLEAVTGGLAEVAAIDALLVKLRQQRQKVDRLRPLMLDALEAVEEALRTHYGVASPKLRHFGLKPAQPRRKLEPAAQVAADRRKLETRAIRHTLSKKQQGKLKSGPVAVSVAVKKR